MQTPPPCWELHLPLALSHPGKGAAFSVLDSRFPGGLLWEPEFLWEELQATTEFWRHKSDLHLWRGGDQDRHPKPSLTERQDVFPWLVENLIEFPPPVLQDCLPINSSRAEAQV